MRGLLILSIVLGAAGCTFGEQPRVSLETRNLELWGDVGELEGVDRLEGSVEAGPIGDTLDEGTSISLDAGGGAERLWADIEVDGNLGALCTGSEVQLQARSGELQVVSIEGAPPSMQPDLEALRIAMRSRPQGLSSTSGTADIEPQRLTLRAVQIEGSEFARVELESQHVHDGVEQSYGGSFEIARVEQDRDRSRTRSWD